MYVENMSPTPPHPPTKFTAFFFYFRIHSVRYDILKLRQHQQRHNSTVSLLLLLHTPCMFRHFRHPQGPYIKILLKCTAIRNLK